MKRNTVDAAKDQRAAPIPRVPEDGWPNSIAPLSASLAETLVAVVQTLCPHSWLGLASYRDATFAMWRDFAADPPTRDLMVHGLADIESLGFAAMAEDRRQATLRERAGTPFFNLCLFGAVRYLYDLPEVWAGCGYDGAAGCSDDAPRKDFNTLEQKHDPLCS